MVAFYEEEVIYSVDVSLQKKKELASLYKQLSDKL